MKLLTRLSILMVLGFAVASSALASSHTLASRAETLQQVARGVSASCEARTVSPADCAALTALVPQLYRDKARVTPEDFRVLALIKTITDKYAIGLPRDRIADALQHLVAATQHAEAVSTHVLTKHRGQWAHQVH